MSKTDVDPAVFRAMQLTKEARELNLTIQRSSLALGKIYKEVVETSAFTAAGYGSFDDWLEAVGDIKRSQAYSVIRTYTELSTTMSEEEMRDLPLNNAKDLTKIPEEKRTEEVKAAARELPNRKFREYIENRVVKGLNLDKSDYKTFQFDQTARVVIEETIVMVMEREGLKTEGAALEFLCSDYQNSVGGEESRKYKAALMVSQSVDAAIIDPNVAMVPELLAWGKILAAVSYLQRVFRLPAREVITKPRTESQQPVSRLQ